MEACQTVCVSQILLEANVINRLGMGMQFVVLAGLPMLIYWQLLYGFKLVLMPACLLLGIVIFTIGTKLRES